jgi:hypothetical protein
LFQRLVKELAFFKNSLPPWLIEAAKVAARKEGSVPEASGKPGSQGVPREVSGTAKGVQKTKKAGNCAPEPDSEETGLIVLKLESETNIVSVATWEKNSEANNDSKFKPGNKSETKDDYSDNPSDVRALEDQLLLQPVVSKSQIFLPGPDGSVTQQHGRTDPMFDIYLKRKPRLGTRHQV